MQSRDVPFSVAVVSRLLAGLAAALAAAAAEPPPASSRSSTEGPRRLEVPAGDNGHWKVVDGVIDYDARSEAPGDKDLWTEREYGDFVLRVEWRIKETPYMNPNVPIIRPTARTRRARTARRSRSRCPTPTPGSTCAARSKSQVNIWCWPIGLRRGLRLPDGREDAGRRCGPASRRRRTPTRTSASGTPSRSR